MQELTDDQKAMLDVERHWWQYTGGKESAIRERFDWSVTRYYQELNRLLDKPAALAFDPFTVRRLRRMRDERRAVRASVQLGG